MIAALLLIVVIFALGIANLDNNCNWGDDFAAYMADGIAMAEGSYEEQTRLNVILRSGKLVGVQDTHVHAWGFPAIHAITYSLFGFDRAAFSNLYVYKLPSLIALTLMSVICYLFFRRRLGFGISFLMSLALCSHMEFYDAIRNLYNDLFFMALSVSCFYFAEVYLEETKSSAKYLDALILGILIWFSYSVRLNGVVTALCILLAQIIYLLKNKSRPKFLDLLPVLIFGLLFVVFNKLIFPWPTSTSSASDVNMALLFSGISYYFDQLLTWSKHFANICLDIPVSFATTVFYSLVDSPELCSAVSRIAAFILNEVCTFLGVALLVLSVVGMLSFGIKKDTHIVVFILISFFGTSALGLRQELRYLYVILPYILMFAVLGVNKILKFFQRKNTGPQCTKNKLLSGIVTAVLCIFAVLPALECGIENVTNYTQENLTAYSSHAIEVYNYIDENLGEDETVAFFKPRALYLNTGRISILPHEGGLPITNADYYLEYKPAEEPWLTDELKAQYTAVFENAEFILHRKIA